MTQSQTIGKLAEALAAAQAKFRPVTKDRNASIVSKTGGSFRYSYADLATAVSAIKDALSSNGLCIMQPAHAGDGTVLVTTILAHSSGEWISEVMTWPVVSTDNRSIGSGITYARRHSLLAMVGAAATDEDDDGEQARGGDHDTKRVEDRPPAPKAPPVPEAARPGVVLWGRIYKRDGKAARAAYDKALEAAGIPPRAPQELTDPEARHLSAILFPDDPPDSTPF